MSHFVHRRTQLTDCDALVQGLKNLGFNPMVNDAKDHVIIPGEQVGYQKGSVLAQIAQEKSWSWRAGYSLQQTVNFRQGSNGVFFIEHDDDLYFGAMPAFQDAWQNHDLEAAKQSCTEFMEGANRAGCGIDRSFENVVYTEYTIAKIRAIAAEQGMTVADVIRNEDGTCRVVVEDRQAEDIFGDVFTETATNVDAFAEVCSG